MSLYDIYALCGQILVAAEETHAAGSAGPSIPAQIVTVMVCFAAVYLLLRKFAFGPILTVLDERSNRIKSDLQRAEELQRKAEIDRVTLEERLNKIEDEARERMQELVAEGKRVADSIKEKAQEESTALLDKAQKNIEYETQKARVTLKKDIIEMTVEATERLINERLDDEKHRELIGDFLTRIEERN